MRLKSHPTDSRPGENRDLARVGRPIGALGIASFFKFSHCPERRSWMWGGVDVKKRREENLRVCLRSLEVIVMMMVRGG